MLPSKLYQEKLNSGEIKPDSKQQIIINLLDELADNLAKQEQGVFNKLKKIFHEKKLIQGLYLWGSVGIGKTFMMDIFFESLNIKKKKRIHFHKFMDNVHKDLNQYLGKKNPLSYVAKHIAENTRVLCFDEFFVKDITDAMVFVGLLKELFDLGVCLIATSNCQPNDLYKNGLQRQNFLPAIKLIEKNTQVIHLDSAMDYRTQHLTNAGVYYTPLDRLAQSKMEKAFLLYAEGVVSTDSISVIGREVEVVKRADKIIWFDFAKICGVPRSQRDYLELVKIYKIILVSNIPQIKPIERDYITCFINFVDILYDARIKLIVSAEVKPHEIYNSGKLNFEFGRTESRLLEMQSSDYFGD